MKADLAWLDTFLADWRRQHPHVEPDSAGEYPADAVERRPTPDPLKMLQQLKRLSSQSPTQLNTDNAPPDET